MQLWDKDWNISVTKCLSKMTKMYQRKKNSIVPLFHNWCRDMIGIRPSIHYCSCWCCWACFVHSKVISLVSEYHSSSRQTWSNTQRYLACSTNLTCPIYLGRPGVVVCWHIHSRPVRLEKNPQVIWWLAAVASLSWNSQRHEWRCNHSHSAKSSVTSNVLPIITNTSKMKSLQSHESGSHLLLLICWSA